MIWSKSALLWSDFSYKLAMLASPRERGRVGRQRIKSITASKLREESSAVRPRERGCNMFSQLKSFDESIYERERSRRSSAAGLLGL